MENIIILGMFIILPLLFIYFVISIVKDISDRGISMSSMDIPDSMKPSKLANSITDIFVEGLKVAKSLIPEKNKEVKIKNRVQKKDGYTWGVGLAGPTEDIKDSWSTAPESKKVTDIMRNIRDIQLKQGVGFVRETGNTAFDAQCVLVLTESGYSLEKATAYVRKLRYKLSEGKSNERVNKMLDNIVTYMARKKKMQNLKDRHPEMSDSIDRIYKPVFYPEDENDCWSAK